MYYIHIVLEQHLQMYVGHLLLIIIYKKYL